MFKPDAKVALCLFVANCYRERNDLDTALDWLAAGYPSARTVTERNSLNRATREVVDQADQKTLRRQLAQSPSDFLRVFLEFRLAQLEMTQGQGAEARNRLTRLQAQSKNHPLAGDIQAALQGAPVAKAAPATRPPSPIKQPVSPGFTPPPQAPGAAIPVDTTLPLNPDRIGCLVPLNLLWGAGKHVLLKGGKSGII